MYSAASLALLAVGGAVFAAGDAPKQLGPGKQAIAVPRAILPAMRFARDVGSSSGCDSLEIECGGYCYDLDTTCCADGETACDITDNCQQGDDGRYGCCSGGTDCVGSAPDDGDNGSGPGSGSSPTYGGGGGSGGYSTPTPTSYGGSSGGSSSSGGDDDGDSSSSDDADSTSSDDFGLPTNTGLGGIGGGGSSSPTGGVSNACQSDISELQKNPAPTPPPDLASALGSSTDFCNFDPGTLSSEWNSYTKSVESWGKDNKDLLKKIQSDCGSSNKIPDVSSCSGSGSSSSSSSSSGSSSGSDSSSDSGSDSGAGSVSVGNGVIVAGAVVGLVAALL